MLATVDVLTYLPLGIMIAIAVTFAGGVIILTKLIGPSRTGPTKGMPYESGMNPVGTARKRFNVRFYLIAMVFLLFDVEVIFFYPWAVILNKLKVFGLIEMAIFLGILLIGYFYVWKKGAFEWD